MRTATGSQWNEMKKGHNVHICWLNTIHPAAFCIIPSGLIYKLVGGPAKICIWSQSHSLPFTQLQHRGQTDTNTYTQLVHVRTVLYSLFRRIASSSVTLNYLGAESISLFVIVLCVCVSVHEGAGVSGCTDYCWESQLVLWLSRNDCEHTSAPGKRWKIWEEECEQGQTESQHIWKKR